MPYLSLTSWSLHRNLGPLRWTGWDEQHAVHVTHLQDQPELHTLLELPFLVADKGFAALEICHFHFPDTSDTYLYDLRHSFLTAGIRFYTLLLEYGDISSADSVRRTADIAWIKSWLDIASLVGAERVRIIAGDAEPTDREALTRSIDAIKELIVYANSRNVRLITENFHQLSSTADNCLALLEACGEDLGLISDFGNYKGSNKYDELIKTLPLSEMIHAKAQTNEQGLPDAVEFMQCMERVKQAGYEGPITLVYDGPNDMWEGIERVRKLVLPFL